MLTTAYPIFSILPVFSMLRRPVQIPRNVGHCKWSVRAFHPWLISPYHLHFLQTFSSSSVLTQLQAVRVAIRRGDNLQRACGRQLGSPHTQVATYTSVGYLPTLPFGFALLQSPVDIQSRLFRDWKPPNIQINALWEGSARGSSPVTGRCMVWHLWFPGGSWQDTRCSCFPLCP